MVCQFLLYNKVNQLYIYICSHISSHLHLPPTRPPLSHTARWSKSTEMISLCYAVVSHQLSILCFVVYICPCHSLTSSQLTLPPPRVLKSILCVYIFFPALPLGLSVPFFFFLDSLYMCQHTVFVFLFLTYFTLYDKLQVHLTANNSISFLLRLSNIPLYICATSSLSIHLAMDTQVASMSWLL